MGKHPDLSALTSMFGKGQNFELTDAQYERKTGVPLPKGSYYLRNRSAVARVAMENGYSIEVIEKRIVFTKK